MGTDDKFDNKVDEVRGEAKEHIGHATGDENLEAQGKSEQTGSKLKQAGEKIKDAFS